MKAISLLLLLTSSTFILSEIPSDKVVTKIIKPNGDILLTGKIKVEVEVTKGSLKEKDLIIFSMAEGIEINPNITITSSMLIRTSISKIVSFKKAGKYEIFVKRGEDIVKQGNQNGFLNFTLEYPEFIEDIITAVTAKDPIINKAIKYRFTVSNPGVIEHDQLYLSIDNPTADDQLILFDDSLMGMIEREFTLTAAGNYSAYIIRNKTTKKQIASPIEVTINGLAISISFTFLLVLFLLLL